LLLLNAITVLVYVAFLYGLMARGHAIQFGAVFLLAVLTLVVVTTTNSVRNAPAFVTTTQVVRIFAGFALIVVAFLAHKHEHSRFSGIGVTIGAIIAFSAVTDLGFASISRFWPTDTTYLGYRIPYDLTNATEQDIVLVGDSFVWGAGVDADQRFGAVLERLLESEGKGPRVYSLGIRGTNVRGYIQQIQDLPATSKVKQIVLCFYANDMPPRANLHDTLQGVAVSVGSGSATLRMLVHQVQFSLRPNAEAFAKLLHSHYAESDRTFDSRWEQLEQELKEFYQLATARSYRQPMIMILPMLVDFERSAFDEPMWRVSKLAASVGYDVVDTMPAFRADGEKAERYRAAPEDLHLNEHGNRIVAEVLSRAIANTP